MAPPVSPEVLADATAQCKAYYQELSLLLQKRGLKPLPEIRIYVSNKLRRNYGYCAFRRKPGGYQVEKIAIAYMAFRKGPSMWKDVVAHEAAHAYCIAWHNRTDHSPSWKHIARLLGCSATVVGCEDPRVRAQAVAASSEVPTTLTQMTGRDRAAVKLSLRAQQRRHRDIRKAVEETVLRFPQFDSGFLRAFLHQECGLPVQRGNQYLLPF